MSVFYSLIVLELLVHLVSSDVSLTIGPKQTPVGYHYSGSYSTVAPENKAQYVASYSPVAPEIRYVGSYSSAAPDIKSQYVASYSTPASNSKGQYVASYSSAAPENKAEYIASYSTPAPENKAKYVGYYSTPASSSKAQYVGSYSTAAPDNKAQYVASYSTPASNSKAQYVTSYSSAAPENKAEYVASYSTSAPENKAQYVGYYSTAAPENKAQYVASYSTPAYNNKAQYVASYSSAAPDNKAQYVASYSTPASTDKAQYVASYSSAAPENKAEYVASYSTPAPENKAQYVGYYSTAAPDNKAQYVASYSNPASRNKAQYVSSYSSVAPDSKAQYVSTSSKSSYDAYPSGQISSERQHSANHQEYNPQYQNDRGVILISKELQVPFVASKQNEESKNCDDNTDDGKTDGVQAEESPNTEYGVHQDENNQQIVPTVQQNVESNEQTKPVYKTSKYEVRRPGIRKEFYDIEEKVFIKPAGSAIFELQHDKPHTAAILNKHIYQQQSYPYPQYSYDDSQYYPQVQQYANHGYHPVVIQPAPSPGYGHNPGHSPPRPHVTYPDPHQVTPVYPSTTVTPEYVPPVTGGYLPPCEEVPAGKPHAHELSEDVNDDESDEDEHDYDSDAGYISPIKEEKQDFVGVVYASDKGDKSNQYRQRENYQPPEGPVYSPEARIDRLRVEYKNQRGDVGQQKLTQYRQQFHQEYVPNGNVNARRVQVRPNGDPTFSPAKYSEDERKSQLEIENSQRLLDLYSANGDVTEIGFGGKSQRYKAPSESGNVRARVVSVTPAPEYANYVDEQHKSRRVVLSKPLYTVQHVEVREHNHRLVEEVQSDSVEPKVSEFQKLRLIGSSSGKTSSQRQHQINDEVEYVTPVAQEYAQLRDGTPVPEYLQN